MSRLDAPAHCALCGEAIPPRAQACPGCGADERNGWREQSVYDGLDLPDEEPSPPQPGIPATARKIVYLVLLILVLLGLLYRPWSVTGL